MSILGKSTDGPGTSASSTDKTVVSKFTADASGSVASGRSWLWVDSGSVSVQLVVYEDSSGEPGARLGVSDASTVTATTESEVNFVFSGANQAAIVNGTAYWVGFAWADPGAASINWSRDSTTSGRREASSAAPNPFGTASSLSGPIDVYVEYFPAVSGDDGGFFEFF